MNIHECKVGQHVKRRDFPFGYGKILNVNPRQVAIEVQFIDRNGCTTSDWFSPSAWELKETELKPITNRPGP